MRSVVKSPMRTLVIPPQETHLTLFTKELVWLQTAQ